jgi:sialate O-acetylesterase
MKLPPIARTLSFIFAVFLTLVGITFAAPEPTPFLSPLFGEHMVLQRGKTNPVWGWTKPGGKVRVTLAGKTWDAVAKPDGRWQVALQPPAPGGPYRLVIEGSQRLEFNDVLVGDVWLCGGQSNMEMGIRQVRNANADIQAADHPNIRLFIVQPAQSYAPKNIPEGVWKVCTPQTIAEDGWLGFSSVGYYFGWKIHKELGVPVGLVQDCLGGTAAEVWTSPEGLKSLPEFIPWLALEAKTVARGGEQYGSQIWHWFEENDPGQKSWFAPDFDDGDWKAVDLPGAFRALGASSDKPVVAYFRKTVELPDPLPPGDAEIQLGQIERMDTVRFNDALIGGHAWVQNPRKYKVGPWLLKPGKNLIVVRVIKTAPDGGFQSPAADMKLVLGDGKEIPLADGWKGSVSVELTPAQLPTNFDTWPANMPSVLYNGMIAPVAPLAISGAIWYQGEANASRAAQYGRLLPAMIADWRRAFGQGDFPFYIVSLASFMGHKDDANAPDEWADLRAAQDMTAQTVPNSGLAVTIDVGDPGDIHPKDKRPVGERLAAIALANHYGKKVPFSGPRYASAKRVPGGLQLSFTHTEGGLVVKGDQLGEFSIAGKDGRWHWADAKIDGNTVIVTSSEVREPMAVRYAWQANPQATLFNGAGFPAVPFQTVSRP